MKSMEEYINDVYKKYDETEKNHKIYKTVKMKYYNPLNTVCNIAACLILVCMFSVGVRFLGAEEEKRNNYVSTEANNDGTVVYTNYLFVDDDYSNRIRKLIMDASYIVVVSNYDITGVNYENDNNHFMLKTVGTLDISRILKGNNDIGKNINFSKSCGTISLKELEQDNDFDWNLWEMTRFGYLISEEEKATTYFKQIPSTGCEFEEGKQYIVFLKYDEENDVYNIFDFAYGILEYDPITNKVKNLDTGEFEDFDWGLINEKIDE